MACTMLLVGFGEEVPAQDEPEPTRFTRQIFAMGTTLRIDVVAPDRPTALAASESCARSIEASEARLSTWRPESEVSRLNRAPLGQPFGVSATLAHDLERALHWQTECAGRFSPTMRALTVAWGLQNGGRQPGPSEIDLAIAASAIGALEFDLPGFITRRIDGAGLDCGGFGKGVALDRAARALLDAGATSALLNFGGQVLVVTAPAVAAASGRAHVRPPIEHVVTVAHPHDRDRAVVHVRVTSGSLATSGNGERMLKVDGRSIGHLLDPRTGHPAPDLGSVTVWADNATDADCLSTALYVLGPTAAMQFADARTGIEALLVELVGDRVRFRATAGLAACMTVVDPLATSAGPLPEDQNDNVPFPHTLNNKD